MNAMQVTMRDIREDMIQREVAAMRADCPALGELQARRAVQMRAMMAAQAKRGGSRVRDCRR